MSVFGLNEYITEYTLHDDTGSIYSISKIGVIGSKTSESLSSHGSWMCVRKKNGSHSYLVNKVFYMEEEGLETPVWIRSEQVELLHTGIKNSHVPECTTFTTPQEVFSLLKTQVPNLI